jgi:crossover junction endodeoxyribonuclease RusA
MLREVCCFGQTESADPGRESFLFGKVFQQGSKGSFSRGGQVLIIDLPFPNSTNTHWRVARGRHYISPKGVAFRQAVEVSARLHGEKAPDGRLQVGVMLYPPDKRKRDIDNYGAKSLLDALTFAGLIEDDSLIDRLVIERGPIVKGGKCRVYISGYIERDNEEFN